MKETLLGMRSLSINSAAYLLGGIVLTVSYRSHAYDSPSLLGGPCIFLVKGKNNLSSTNSMKR